TVASAALGHTSKAAAITALLKQAQTSGLPFDEFYSQFKACVREGVQEHSELSRVLDEDFKQAVIAVFDEAIENSTDFSEKRQLEADKSAFLSYDSLIESVRSCLQIWPSNASSKADEITEDQLLNILQEHIGEDPAMNKLLAGIIRPLVSSLDPELPVEVLNDKLTAMLKQSSGVKQEQEWEEVAKPLELSRQDLQSIEAAFKDSLRDKNARAVMEELKSTDKQDYYNPDHAKYVMKTVVGQLENMVGFHQSMQAHAGKNPYTVFKNLVTPQLISAVYHACSGVIPVEGENPAQKAAAFTTLVYQTFRDTHA
ncbi:hypothetical protein COB21_03305, partial [Candidatus Aerophobetes bacterium]